MAAIVTLTMNPAIDVSTAVVRVEPSKKLRCEVARRDPGGGGVNVARVASRLGADALAAFPAGGLTGQMLEHLIAREGVARLVLPISGDTREDFTVVDRSTGQELRFVLPGPPMQPAEWRACLEAVEALHPVPAFVCASGSLPPGVPETLYRELGEAAVRTGAKFVLDASGAALSHATAGGSVYLLKPNLAELRALTGDRLEDRGAMAEACRGLLEAGSAEVVALTLGDQGALLVASDETLFAPALSITPVSTVGAGDSFLGAMLWALASGRSQAEAFRWGVAAGSASLMVHGTELCRRDEVARLMGQVVTEPL